ncbi:protein trichome birefringence-like 13 isoform X2 [Lycium barbarum]|uniref:protein trichome birefringence-like 13 isoform X2 n=1 Tax=Lycium barbarum TaxID=112863 RepID=UPI00293E0743|nr:protein trichome birefringence-like 13 isoform X2 [Lycium barbarum]
MANQWKKLKQPSSLPVSPSCLFLSLLSFASLFLFLSLFSTSQTNSLNNKLFYSKSCNFTHGRWIYDQSINSPPRYDNTCKEIYKGWSCIGSNKSNALDIVKWRWKPYQCDLPQFDPLHFLQRFRNTNIGFVGDSLNRNMFVSLFCTLKRVSGDVKKWRPAGADRGFTFLKYNLTISYHRTNLLARYSRWWAPSKFDPVKSPMLFFEKGNPVVPPVSPDSGLDMVLKHMISYVDKRMRPSTTVFMRTQSPRHFEGGDWDQGGSCQRSLPLSPQEVEKLFSLQNNGTNVEVRLVNQHLYRAFEGTRFHMLDISHMSEFRADAHPATAGGKKHDDCMHWCLPGLTDIWNDLFVAYLSNIEDRT